MQVFKFGGASVKDAAAIRNLREIIHKHPETSKVVVVSAMDKTTNALENLLELVCEKRDFRAQLEYIEDFHQHIIAELLGAPCPAFDRFFGELIQKASNLDTHNYQRAYDQIVSFGELFATSVIQQFLSKVLDFVWLDARQLLRTDAFHTEANLDWIVTHEQVFKTLRPLLNEGRNVITQGFIGATPEGITTTLGREGSDFTAAILAHCLDAESMTVWKDVPGILNADPKLKPDAIQYEQLSYRQVTEMTYYGAKVIHPKTLMPLAQRNIPLWVRSFKDHLQPGTAITSAPSIATPPTFVFQQNQVLMHAAVKDHSFMNEKKLGSILQALDHLNVKINLMQASALTFSFCMDHKAYKIDRIIEFLSKDFLLSKELQLKLVTVKNYTDDALRQLPEMKEIILEQKTKSTYQALYRDQ